MSLLASIIRRIIRRICIILLVLIFLILAFSAFDSWKLPLKLHLLDLYYGLSKTTEFDLKPVQSALARKDWQEVTQFYLISLMPHQNAQELYCLSDPTLRENHK